MCGSFFAPFRKAHARQPGQTRQTHPACRQAGLCNHHKKQLILSISTVTFSYYITKLKNPALTNNEC